MTHTQTLIQTQTQLVHTQTLTKMMYTKTQAQGHTQIEGKYIILMTTTYLSLFCLMSAGQRVQKHFEGKQKIHNLFVSTIYSSSIDLLYCESPSHE